MACNLDFVEKVKSEFGFQISALIRQNPKSKIKNSKLIG